MKKILGFVVEIECPHCDGSGSNAELNTPGEYCGFCKGTGAKQTLLSRRELKELLNKEDTEN